MKVFSGIFTWFRLLFRMKRRFSNLSNGFRISLSNGEENFVGKHFVGFVFSTTKHLDYLLMNESRIQRTSTKYWHWILPTEYVYQFWKWYHKMHISILFFVPFDTFVIYVPFDLLCVCLWARFWWICFCYCCCCCKLLSKHLKQ